MKWTRLPGLDVPAYSICRSDTGTWLAGTQDGVWRINQSSVERAGLAGVPVTAIAATQRAWLAGAPDGIARSADAGKTWRIVSDEATQITQLLTTPLFNKMGLAYAASLTSGMARSFDIGNSWAPSNQGLTDRVALAMCVTHNFAEDKMLLVAFESGVYRSLDFGTNWEHAPTAAPVLPITSFAVTLRGIWAASESGAAMFSVDFGKTWGAVPPTPCPCEFVVASFDGNDVALLGGGSVAVSRNDGDPWQVGALPDAGAVTALAFDSGELYLSTNSGGIWRTDGSAATD